jgi:hypothetical protein
MLPQAKTHLCDAEWLNCVSPKRIEISRRGPAGNFGSKSSLDMCSCLVYS